ncbi:MAG: polysaccharide deacetylase family protein [Acidobacteriota bacterium]
MPRCVVLYYHSVRGQERVRFARQMDCLLRWRKPLKADDIVPAEASGNSVVITFDDGFQSLIENALPELEKRALPATIFVPSLYLGCSPGWHFNEGCRDQQERVVTGAQLRRLAAGPFTIGSHTATHPHLGDLSDDEARREFVNSKVHLEKASGKPVELLSFPYGECDHRLIELARRCGYKRVFTTQPSTNSFRQGEFVIGRVNVSPNDSLLKFQLKLLGGYAWLPAARAMKRKVLVRWQKLVEQASFLRQRLVSGAATPARISDEGL